MLRVAHEDGRGYDIVHSHYWLSGWVGRAMKESLGRAARHVVPHAGQGQELLARSRRAARARPAARRRAAGDRRRRSDPGADPGRGGAARRACTGPTRAACGSCRRASTTCCSRRGDRRRRASACTCRASASRSTSDGCSRTRAPTSRCGRSPRPSLAIPRSPAPGARDRRRPERPGQGRRGRAAARARAALGVSERVMLFPPQPQAKLVDFYAAADVVLVPSRSESFGLVALEAQACGTPVVAARRRRAAVRGRGRPERLPRRGARSGRPRRAAAARSCETRGCRRAFGDEAARHALRFTWDATTDEMVRVYDEVLACAGRA